MDMHKGSTDEYETDEHYFDGDGDSSDDELLVTSQHVSPGTKKKRVAVVVEKKQKGVVNKNDSNEDDSGSDADSKPKHKRTKTSVSACDSSSDDESEEEATTKNSTIGRMNDTKINTKKRANSFASDDDDSDDDSDDLGLGLGSNKQRRAASERKRAALLHNMYSSSSESSDEDSSEDVSFCAKKRKQSNNNNKNPAAKKASSTTKKATALYDSSSSDDSDSDCVDVTTTASTRSKRQPVAAAAAKAKSSTAAIDCMSSDSDDDVIDIPPARKSMRSTLANPRAKTKTDEGGMHHDPSVRANSNATLEAARRARAALQQSQAYRAEDVNVPSLPSQVAPTAARASPAVLDLSSNDDGVTSLPTSAPRTVATLAVSYNGPTITIYLRYRDSSNKESKVSLKIKMDQPLQYLIDQFKRGTITKMVFDGQNLNLTKTPAFYDMDDEDLVDVTVIANNNRSSSTAAAKAPPPAREEKVVIHVRGAAGTSNETYQMKKSDPLKKVVDDYCRKNRLSTVTLEYGGRKLDASQSCSQLNIANDAYLDAIVAGGPSINLIFRVNGKSNETERIDIRMKESFQQVFETFAQRRNVSVAQCKFVFDGETLRPSTTPEHLDLEGDEIIDVMVTEAARPPSAAQGTAIQSTARAAVTAVSAAIQSTARAAATAVSSASATTSPPVMITIETNRNQNKNPRQKKWKLHDTSLVTKLKVDYIKYYKSKGCKQVKFYIRNQAITNESQSLRDLGIRNGDTVYAMENGKAYKPM